MIQWKSNKLIKKVAALVLCSSMVVSLPMTSLSVHATEQHLPAETTEAATEATTTQENNGNNTIIVNVPSNNDTPNVDANGVLGKNSDVGIEVTKSITGKAGKKVKMSFKIISNNEKTIKLKSVYPVIDNEFPFETSGDAYKVALAGEDLQKAKVMPVEFTMTARSDLETGYHGVKYICEYTKLDGDKNEVAYYVIKTMNIYFSGKKASSSSGGASDSSGGNKSTTNNNSTSNNTTNNYYSNGSDDDDDYDYDDDDDDDSGSSSSSGGNKKSSSGGEAGAPKLLITGFQTKPEKIVAGQKFELVVHVQNTSKKTSVCNGKFLIGNEAGTFLPTSGSNAVFVEKIAPGKVGDLKIELKTSPEMAQKTYQLIVKGDFEDEKGNSYTSNDSLSVQLYQEVKLEITDVNMSPEAIGVGGEGSIMFTINNQGNANVNNVTIATADEAVTSEGCYVGNIAGMGSSYATLVVQGAKDNSETGNIKITISYEDSEGNKGTLDKELACVVGEGIEAEEMPDEGEEELDDEGGMDTNIYLIIAVVGGILLLTGIIILIIILSKRKKKKLAAMLEEDEFGEDDIENEDF